VELLLYLGGKRAKHSIEKPGAIQRNALFYGLDRKKMPMIVLAVACHEHRRRLVHVRPLVCLCTPTTFPVQAMTTQPVGAGAPNGVRISELLACKLHEGGLAD
jgi:hypothetical protein